MEPDGSAEGRTIPISTWSFCGRTPAEVRALCEDLLISVTEFFRDPPLFDAVKEKALAEILRQKQPGEAIRVWVPGCSTGEEVYSLAICLIENMHEAGVEFPVHVFGTDISESSIEKARTGVYGPSTVSVIAPERLKRFFVQVDTGYQIARQSGKAFSRFNVASDTGFPQATVAGSTIFLD